MERVAEDALDELKRTPVFDLHVAEGGRMVPFGGWEMPIQYTSILDEHRAVRERAGLFDVSHMGEIDVAGKDAAAFLDWLVTNRPSDLEVGQVLYTPMTLPDGGVVDDLLVYRLGENLFRLVVNAATTPKDVRFVTEAARSFGGDAHARDVSGDVGQLALQGPRAQAVLQALTPTDLGDIPFFGFQDAVHVAGKAALVSRTGYTGEDGFEIYLAPEATPDVFRAILEAGRGTGVLPAGLGARDSLRFEACLPLYGQEISETTNPVEAGLSPFIKWDKADFQGKEVLMRARKEGTARRLVGIELDERAVPRHGYPVTRDGEDVGQVTSGMISPTLGKPLALAYVPPDLASVGTALGIRIRERDVPGHVVKRPFYRRERTR